MERYLVLEDGRVFEGKAFGSLEDKIGEVVFNTGMTGYQEVLSDPSYYGQMVTMTYPLIGNYGINRDDFESINPHVFGFIVKEKCDLPSNFRSQYSIEEYLKLKNIPGIYDIDTRALTKHIRKYGTIKGILTKNNNINEALALLNNTALDNDHVEAVSTTKSYPSPGTGHRVVLVDFGIKHGILRELNKRNCDVIVVPYNSTASYIRTLNPDGVLLSNGPGDPKDVPDAVEMIKGLKGDIPLFGICLGHQLYCLAYGGNTKKMKFGHRGCNHPVKNLETNKVYITSQNHGYEVTSESLDKTDLLITYKALNDNTVEGIRHKKFPAFSVQFHPEASPGPDDMNSLFDDFIELMNKKDVRKNA